LSAAKEVSFGIKTPAVRRKRIEARTNWGTVAQRVDREITMCPPLLSDDLSNL
jgi:hypothetical protein